MTGTDTELDRKVTQRDELRDMLTDDVSAVDRTMQQVTNGDRDAARKLLGRLKSYKEEQHVCDAYILSNVDKTQYKDELKQVYKYSNSVSETICLLEGRLKDYEMSQAHALPSTSGHCPSSAQLNERIPEMELTEFDGNPLNFEEFWDDFSTTVDKRTDITNITKFKLLRKCLVGKAAASCKGYKLTTANYSQVKSILEERYGDKETAIALHIDALIRLKRACSCAVSELIRVRDECEVHIRALVILGFGDDAFGQLFAPIVLSKLPDQVRLEIRKQKKHLGDATWTIGRLRELLSTEIELRASNEYEFFESRLEASDPATVNAAATSLFVSSNDPPRQRSCAVTCAFCGNRHYSSNCDVFLDVASRQSQMGNRCLLCLRRGHWNAECRAKPRPCFYCKKRDHHCSLCLRKFGSVSKCIATASATEQSGVAPITSYEPHSYLDETTCAASCQPGTSVIPDTSCVSIVETAIATVIGETGSCQARLVLDCGSTKSFVSGKLVRRIGAKLVGYDATAVGRFGDAKRVPQRMARYDLTIVQRDGSHRCLKMNAEESVTPSVTLQPLQPNVTHYHCSANDLAEVLVHKPTEAKVDILVGLDYYYSLVGGREVRTVNGLVLKDSTLGVIVTGCTQPATACQNTVCRERSQPSACSTNCGTPITKLGPLDLSKQALANSQRPASVCY